MRMVKRYMGMCVLLTHFVTQNAVSEVAAHDDLQDMLPLLTPHVASLVWVEYTLRYDGGEAPQGIGWGEVCPNCGRIHGNQLEERMRSGRAIRAPGFLVGEGLVLTPDFWVENRFIESIRVVTSDDQEYAAYTHAYQKHGPGVMLKIDADVDIPVLAFNGNREGPFVVLRRAFMNGQDQIQIARVSKSPVTVVGERSFITTAPGSLIMDEQGRPVGVSLSGELDADENWKGNPLDGVWLDADAVQQEKARVEDVADHGLVMVSLYFRSSPPVPGQGLTHSRSFHFSRPAGGMSVDENATEHHAPGVIVAPDQVLVLAGIPFDLLTRLDRVELSQANGQRVEASFAGAFKDYDALLVTPSKPMNSELVLDPSPIQAYRNRLLMGVDLHLEASRREMRIRPVRFDAMDASFDNQIVPSFVNVSPQMFVFSGEKLVLIPMQRRDRIRALEGGRFRSANVYHQPLSYWQALLQNPAEHFDAAMRPREEDEAWRVAWIGVELQPMSHELALAHGVLRQTEHGQRGAMISHIYRDSPAAKTDLQNGDILLWAEVEGLAAPIPVRTETSVHGRFPFQWEMLDRFPAQHFDQMPAPWPEIRTPFNRMLTQLEEGASVRFKLIRDGELLYSDFTLEMSPPCYTSAGRYQDADTGITARDFTFEVRHFLKAEPTDPGVVVARVNSGGKAWVAGIRPYELITHVNGEAIVNVAEFEERMQEPGDKQLTVKRMASTRLVHIAGSL